MSFRDETNPKVRSATRVSRRDNERKTSLLEELRKVGSWWQVGAYHEKMTLVLDNISQFPRKLRPAITEAENAAIADSDSLDFMPHNFYNIGVSLVKIFLFGWPVPTLFLIGFEGAFWLEEKHEPTEWLGLDCDVDSKDEIELLIRAYPSVFELRMIASFHHGCHGFGRHDLGSSFLIFLASSEKAVSFIPFIVDLAAEVQKLHEINFVDLAAVLLNNTIVTKRFNKPPPAKLVEASLSVLLHLREKGHIKDSMVYQILDDFIDWIPESMSFACIEKRIRLLIQWDPTILNPPGRYSYRTSLLNMVADRGDVRLYELALELGTIHYPNELLGFGFHDSRLYGTSPSFEFACRCYGNKKAKRAMDDTIAATLARSNQSNNAKALLDWVIKAASDDSIHADGLYQLIRFNPSMFTNSIQRGD